MKIHLTKRRRFIRKPSMAAGTATTLNSHHLQHNLLTPQEGTTTRTLFGTIPLLAKMWLQTLAVFPKDPRRGIPEQPPAAQDL